MKLSICITDSEDGANEGDSSCYDYEKISSVLEQELSEIYPASKN